jgi:hypothetical protein
VLGFTELRGPRAAVASGGRDAGAVTANDRL